MLNGGNMKNSEMITKLENALAIAILNNDNRAEQQFTAALEAILNQTDFPKVSA
jgi:hypothetical protein